MTDFTVCAVPDPHIERWLLLDSAAFKEVLGKGCPAPDQRCERDRYKQQLLQAIRDTGRTPLLGGMEHAESLINAFDIARIAHTDNSFGKLVSELDDWFRKW